MRQAVRSSPQVICDTAVIQYLSTRLHKPQPKIEIFCVPERGIVPACALDGAPAEYHCRSENVALSAHQAQERYFALGREDVHVCLPFGSWIPEEHRVRIDRVGRGFRRQYSHLTSQVIWCPVIVRIQQSDKRSPRLVKASISCVTYAVVWLLHIDDVRHIRQEHPLEFRCVRAPIVDDDD